MNIGGGGASLTKPSYGYGFDFDEFDKTSFTFISLEYKHDKDLRKYGNWDIFVTEIKLAPKKPHTINHKEKS